MAKIALGKRSFADRNHRELVWALYCARGGEGGVRHARTVNNYTLSRRDLRELQRLERAIEQAADAFAEYVASRAGQRGAREE